MATSDAYVTIAGDSAEWDSEIKERVRERGEALTTVQEDQHRRGRTDVTLVPTIHGWSLRYGSGLNGFGLIAGSMTRDEAVAYAKRLVTERGPKWNVIALRKDMDNTDPAWIAKGHGAKLGASQ